MIPLNPEAYLQHGILGGFILVLLVGIVMGFRLVARLIDTLQDNGKEHVSALKSVEGAVEKSISRADQRHNETINAFLRSGQLVTETREALAQWTLHCKQHCGFSANGLPGGPKKEDS